MHTFWRFTGLLVLSLAISFGGSPSSGLVEHAVGGQQPPIVHVEGNHLVNEQGQVVQLIGLNRSGTEYACDEGWGIFDGPVGNAAIAAMMTWRPQVVRLPLNEDCWLGINGVDRRYGGAAY